ncbi:hypothetical protein Hanom_Chr06g00542541 [Helianthus anomalus]
MPTTLFQEHWLVNFLPQGTITMLLNIICIRDLGIIFNTTKLYDTTHLIFIPLDVHIIHIHPIIFDIL